MIRYYAFYNGIQHEIFAENYKEAKKQAIIHFKIKQNFIGLLEILKADEFDNNYLTN